MRFQTERNYTFTTIDQVTNFRDFIVQFNAIYTKFANWKVAQLTGYNAVADELARSLYRTFVAEAKRVRPMFAYLTHRLLNNHYYPEDIIRLGTGMEYFHDFALIHDDITDLSDKRRGEPTIEKEFRDNYAHKGPTIANHIGLNAALYAGDIALFQSTYMIDTLQVAPQTLARIQDIFYEMQTEVALGQVDDGFGVRHDTWDKITEERIKGILSLKSGRYTIQKPMMLGAALAEVDEDVIQKIESFGEEFGIVFQIKDDLLGLFGDEEEMGKSNTSDITEGKKTLLMYETYQQTDSNGKKLIETVLGNKDATQSEIEELKELVATTGVKQKYEDYCKKGTEAFVAQLTALPNVDKDILKVFSELAWYIVERTK